MDITDALVAEFETLQKEYGTKFVLEWLKNAIKTNQTTYDILSRLGYQEKKEDKK